MEWADIMLGKLLVNLPFQVLLMLYNTVDPLVVQAFQQAFKEKNCLVDTIIMDSPRFQSKPASRLGCIAARPASCSGRTFHESPDRHAYKYEGRRRPTLPDAVRESSPPDRSRIGKWRDAKHHQRIHDEFPRCPTVFQIVD